MRNRVPTLNFKQHYWIRQWHGALRRHKERPASIPKELLKLGLGDRARLRRAANGLELAGEPAVHLLVSGLIDRRQDWRFPENSARDYYRLAIVAGVLVKVDTDLGAEAQNSTDRQIRGTLARQLGAKKGEARVMSELRFRRLQATTDSEGLLRLWRRAVALGGNRADVATLADDLFTWLEEIEHKKPSPIGSVRFHWAYDYYQQPRDENSSGESTPQAEAVA